MARLSRKTQKIFASNTTSDQITAFGTAKTSQPVYTNDVSTIQTNTYTQGWTPSLMSDLAPYLQDSNALWYVITSQMAYVYQEGIPEYDANTTYYTGSIVKSITNNEVNLYTSLTNDNIGNSLTDGTYWKSFNLGASDIGSPIIRLDNTLNDNEIRLEGAIVSRITYAELFAKYGTTYGAGDGINTFQLPDFRNRVMWGGENLGYLNEQLPNHTHDYETVINYSLASYGQGSFTHRIVTKQTSGASNNSYVDNGVVRPASIKVRVVTRYK